MAAVTAYGVEAFAGLVGRFGLGVLADRSGVKRMLIAGLAIQALPLRTCVALVLLLTQDKGGLP